MGLHTLVLLDIQAEKNVYMTAIQGIDLLLKMEKEIGENVITQNDIVCVVARAGSSNPTIKANKAQELVNQDFGSPLHTLVIPGDLHFMEIESLVKIQILLI